MIEKLKMYRKKLYNYINNKTKQLVVLCYNMVHSSDWLKLALNSEIVRKAESRLGFFKESHIIL